MLYSTADCLADSTLSRVYQKQQKATRAKARENCASQKKTRLSLQISGDYGRFLVGFSPDFLVWPLVPRLILLIGQDQKMVQEKPAISLWQQRQTPPAPLHPCYKLLQESLIRSLHAKNNGAMGISSTPLQKQ
jgi:hypothetical protein